MGFGSFYLSTPGWGFSTEEYFEYINKHCHIINDDDEKIVPDWFHLPYCDECEKYIGFVKICFHHLSQ